MAEAELTRGATLVLRAVGMASPVRGLTGRRAVPKEKRMNGTKRMSVQLLLVTSFALAAPGVMEGQLTPPAVAPAPQRQPVVMTLPPGALAAARPPGTAALAQATAPDPAVEAAVARLLASARIPDPSVIQAQATGTGPGEAPRLSRGDRGWLRSVGAPPGGAFTLPPIAGPEAPSERAARFLTEHAIAFGVAKRAVQLRADRIKVRDGRRFLRLSQEFRGITVFSASAIVQLDTVGDVEFALSDLARDDARFHHTDFAIAPIIGADEARALALTVPELGPQVQDLVASEPILMIYEPSVIGNPGGSRLVWQVEVTSRALPIDELVLVDARSAETAFHFSQIMSAKYREVYDCGAVYGDACGAPVRVEGQAATGLPDADTVYDYLGDVYTFYWSNFGRDSVDGTGMTLKGLVRYCESPPEPCPLQNAYWDKTNNRMMFGTGFIADDVVGHEVTHGVTSSESALIYWGESGAINESLSDIFGELVDLGNGAGTDTPAVRWIVGEDLPVSSYRNMKNPPEFGQPDRRLSSLWYTADGDLRGVHYNSGVGNKLAYLLTDGDSFNGWTVGGLGITKVAALFYEAQVGLLFPGADYYDLYDVLKQAAINNGWTLAERANLERACRAVEIAFSGTPVAVTNQGFEGSFPPPGWTVSGGSTQWGRSTCNVSGNATGKAWCAAGGSLPQPSCGYYANSMSTWLIYGPFSLANAERAWMELWLWSGVEATFDYVYLGVSTNGASFSGDFIKASTSSVWVRELLDFNWFGSVVGQPSVWIGLNFTSDPSGNAYYGSYVDDVLIRKTSCVSPSGPTLTAPTSGTSGTGYTISWTATSPLNTYEIQESTDPAFGSASTWSWSDTGAMFTHTLASDTTYYYRVRATDTCSGSLYASSWSNVGQTLVRAPRTLSVAKAGTGSGTVTSDPAGITCGATCTTSFSYGTVVTLSATPAAGSAFTSWSGEGCSGAGTCQVTMSQARNVTATFAPTTATRFFSVTPCRVVDTRNPTGPFGGPALAATATRSFALGGSCGVPSDAVALSMNVTVADASTPGTLTMYPGTGPAPETNTLSFVPGKNRANNVNMGLIGSVLSVVDYQATGTVHLIIDVNGYYR